MSKVNELKGRFPLSECLLLLNEEGNDRVKLKVYIDSEIKPIVYIKKCNGNIYIEDSIDTEKLSKYLELVDNKHSLTIGEVLEIISNQLDKYDSNFDINKDIWGIFEPILSRNQLSYEEIIELVKSGQVVKPRNSLICAYGYDKIQESYVELQFKGDNYKDLYVYKIESIPNIDYRIVPKTEMEHAFYIRRTINTNFDMFSKYIKEIDGVLLKAYYNNLSYNIVIKNKLSLYTNKTEQEYIDLIKSMLLKELGCNNINDIVCNLTKLFSEDCVDSKNRLENLIK